MKTLSLFALLLIIMLNGCSMSSFLFGLKSENPVFLADAPPVRISYSGKFDEQDLIVLDKVLKIIKDIPYKDHKYTFPLSANISINEADHSSTRNIFKGATSDKGK